MSMLYYGCRARRTRTQVVGQIPKAKTAGISIFQRQESTRRENKGARDFLRPYNASVPKRLFVILVLFSAACSETTAVSPAAPPNCTIAPPPFADGGTPAGVRHVAVDGNDTTGDGSVVRPFRTLIRAAQNLSPGTAIYLHAGTHPGGALLSDVRGTAKAPIWIAGAPGESHPVIKGGGDALHLVRPKYLVIQDLEIRDAAGNGLNIDDGDDVRNADAARFVVLRRLVIDNAGVRPSGIADCVKLAGVSDVAVVDSTIGRCGDGPGSGAVGVGGVGVHRATVAFNRFTANGYGAVQFKGGSDEIEIVGNMIRDAGWRGVNMGGRTSAQFFRPPLSDARPNYEAARIRVRANMFAGGEAAAAFTGCVDCEFIHNVVVDPQKWALRILQETVSLGEYSFAPASRGRIADNIFYFRRADVNTGEDINIGANTDPASFSLTRNAWYAHDAPRQSSPRLGALPADHDATIGVDPHIADLRLCDSDRSPERR